MRILLTGGAGYIGSHVSLELLDKGHEVTIIDNLVNGSKKLLPAKANFLECDISDENKISNLLINNKFEVVMHFAGFTRVGESTKFPEKYYENNFEKPKKFFDICIKNNLNKFIFSSTGSVYGNVSIQKNIPEDYQKLPLNPYSESKYKLENHLISLSEDKKISTIILRYFNVAGADQNNRSGLITNPDNLIKAICEVAVGKRQELTINGNDYNTKDGTTIRDYIHVTDLAEMHILAADRLIKKNITDIYNCGYGVGFSIGDVIKSMNKILNKDIKIKYGARRKGDAEYSVSDNTKFLNEFNWTPKMNSLEKILTTSLNWEKIIEKKHLIK
tara:strand:- start:1151 stop:2143 length:993 start_codon:yes stop_codon:yes gene_type:complete